MTRLLTAIASAIIFCSCQSITGSGNIVTQTRHLNQFDGVRSSGSIDVEVMNNQSQLVKIEADDNILPYIITKVENGMLDVHFKSGYSYNTVNVKVFVSGPSFTKLTVSGSGSILSKDTLANAEQIDFKVSGSGDIIAIVDAPSIFAGIGGSGTITLKGRTKEFNCNINGSGDMKCKYLLSENTNISVSGSGTAHVFASVHLTAKVTGSGDIYYTGSPAVEMHRTSSGNIEQEK